MSRVPGGGGWAGSESLRRRVPAGNLCLPAPPEFSIFNLPFSIGQVIPDTDGFIQYRWQTVRWNAADEQGNGGRRKGPAGKPSTGKFQTAPGQKRVEMGDAMDDESDS